MDCAAVKIIKRKDQRNTNCPKTLNANEIQVGLG